MRNRGARTDHLKWLYESVGDWDAVHPNWRYAGFWERQLANWKKGVEGWTQKRGAAKRP